MSLRISCIQKTNRSAAHERIKKVGGTNPDGTRWWLTADEAIAGIESRRYDFYVQVHGRRVDVVLAEQTGRLYLKTENDGYSPDNLLALPECP
jgi:hypothetical protein